MRMLKTFLLFFVLSVVLAGCSTSTNSSKEAKKPADRVELTVSAAISLTDALEEIKNIYEEDHNVSLRFNLGGSGKLAQQIKQGAPVDAFVSANQDWMDKLEDEELILPATREDVTGNKIVLIVKKGSSVALQSIEDISAGTVEQIAIGNPESVPAGQYAEQTLQTLNKWDALKDKMVLAKDVRQVLTYVETGNVDIGFVYESDALTSKSVKILATAENGLHDPIIYPAAVLKESKYEKEASEFVAFLVTDEAQKILERHGFRK
ncbi:molybdate ABC transporter substrate-binding protein [Filibacter tadaridae]|uniref:Molybdate-binding periplasmic protein n=1 Tax=Filibacter tadaridae TaxID=2483811 RepID=A0A3P5WSM1_9BACL|nr:molybdate ABC transporter substrate-binding protein [Filibacter tadaridae]VDC24222.1 Molybdate-binding periplasmic protein precursor [Filibacter tadaridae]